jgi:hypothetical protein
MTRPRDGRLQSALVSRRLWPCLDKVHAAQTSIGRCFTVVDLLFSMSVFKEPNDPSDREVLW